MGHCHYITRKECKIKGLSGLDVDIPFGSIAIDNGHGIISYNGKDVCYSSSLNAINYFVHNDDGEGQTRAFLVNGICDMLQLNDGQHRKRIYKIWDDNLCQKYKRKESTTSCWIWTRRFYDAPIEDLEHIYLLLKGV